MNNCIAFTGTREMATILVVDDEDQVREVVCMVLERAGYVVSEAHDGDEALSLYRENPPDVVVTDLVMQRMGGLQLIERLREEFPDAKIIAISAYVDALTDPRTHGADKSLRKPFSIEELRSAVEELLEGGQ